MRQYRIICQVNSGTKEIKCRVYKRIKQALLSLDTIFNNVQLLLLKGSSFEVVKYRQNNHLEQILKRKICAQIPNKQVRKLLWVQFTQIYQNYKLYNDLKQFELVTDFQINIQKDILRTYKSEEVKKKTKQVLQIFSHYNPYIGYCQGMNSIVAFLIDQSFTCQQSFFIFKRISEILLPCDYYCSMDSIMAYMRIFYEMLNITHPQCYSVMKKISKEMDNSYMAMVSFVLQWFVCLYTNQSINMSITRVIWDYFLIQGITVLFKAGLGMFDLLQPFILKCKTYQQYNQMQKKHIKSINDPNHIRKRLTSTYISPQLLNLLKQKLTQQDEKNNKKHTNAKKARKQGKKCNRKWNACVQSLQENLNNYYTYEFFVFKPKMDIKITQNYLQKLDKMYFNQNQQPKQPRDGLLVGRIPHICPPQQQQLTQDSLSQNNSDSNKQKGKAYLKSLTDPKSPIRLDQQFLRKKAVIKVEQVMNKKHGMQRSQSMIFMRNMVQNVSFSNLLELYEIDELFQ